MMKILAPVGLRRGAVLSAMVIVAVALAVPASAQRGPSGRRGGAPQDRAELERRFRRQMARLVQERLGLTEEQAGQLSTVVAEFEDRRRELGRAEEAARRRVEALMLEGGEDESEAEELLSRMVELRRAESDLFAEEQTALLEVISPMQILQMHTLREQLGRRIREIRGEGGRPGRGRGREGGADLDDEGRDRPPPEEGMTQEWDGNAYFPGDVDWPSWMDSFLH